MKRDPKVLIEWCRKEIKINNELNSQQIPISPMGVWKARVADEKSRDIFLWQLTGAWDGRPLPGLMK